MFKFKHSVTPDLPARKPKVEPLPQLAPRYIPEPLPSDEAIIEGYPANGIDIIKEDPKPEPRPYI